MILYKQNTKNIYIYKKVKVPIRLRGNETKNIYFYFLIVDFVYISKKYKTFLKLCFHTSKVNRTTACTQ